MDPAVRGNGLGHALLTQVENEIGTRGGRLLLIETSTTLSYASARHLYEKSGYRCEALIHDFYAPGDDLLVYVKDVKENQHGQELADIYHGALADIFVEAAVCAKEQVIGCRPLRHQGDSCLS